jgi:hypothetical protein
VSVKRERNGNFIFYLPLDHIKTRKLKPKIPPKNTKLPPLFPPQKIKKKNQKIQKWPHGFSPRKLQNYPQIIQKKPQTLQKDLKNENKDQIVIFGVFFVFF